MRCMTSIGPAGLPKLSAATRTHTQKASRNETPWRSRLGAAASAKEVFVTAATIRSRSRATAWGMFLGSTPAVERVIDDHALREHCVIVGEIDLEPLRDREEALRLRRKVGMARIGAADDQGEAIDRPIRDAIGLDDGIEAAELAMMTELDIRDVVWCRADVLGRFEDSGGGGRAEFRPPIP